MIDSRKIEAYIYVLLIGPSYCVRLIINTGKFDSKRLYEGVRKSFIAISPVKRHKRVNRPTG